MKPVLLVSKSFGAGKVGRNELNSDSSGSECTSSKRLAQSLQVEGIMR